MIPHSEEFLNLIKQKNINLENSLQGFLNSSIGEYYMIMTPEITNHHYYTVIKVENKEKASKNLANFISKHIGNVTKIDVQTGYRFDFYVDETQYCLFNYDQGLVVI